MKTKTLLALWGDMFILCAGLGFIPEPTGIVRWALTALSVAFFLPPFALLRKGDRSVAALVRNLAAASLGLTLLALIANVLTASGSETLGNAMHYILTVVSSPMVCSGYWALSLFLWACVLMAALDKCGKK